MRREILFIICLLFLPGLLMPGLAQEPPAFVTNTPAPLAPVITTPAAPINRYALRQWQAANLIDVLQTRIRQLTPGATELQKAIQLTQFELGRRFPNARTSSSTQINLLNVMLNAPVGSVDMRQVARPFFVNALNERGNLLPFSLNNFMVEPITLDLDGSAPLDAILHVQYPETTLPLRYVDYIPVVGTTSGSYTLLVSDDLPAAPVGPITDLMLLGVGDFNSDGLDELAVALTTSDLNQDIRIFGWRGGNLVNLVEPGERLHFREITNGLLDNDGMLSVVVYREASPAWQCQEQLDVSWRWNSNFYRPFPSSEGYFFQNSANCLFFGSEPLFAQSLPDALTTLNQILDLVPSETDYSAQRAAMYQVMLRLFDGDVGTALAQALQLEGQAEPDTWLAEQVGTFITALDEDTINPLSVCAALIEASDYGACDVDAALTRIFEEQPLTRDLPIRDQLAEMGITVLHEVTISEVGKVNRNVVHFQLGGDHWWAFAPLDTESYTAERTEPLPQFAPVSMPVPVLVAPASMYETLLVNNDPVTLLNTLDNMQLENPQAAVSPELRFLEALSLDLIANRSRAREAYYALWQAAPLSIWGQLAADHLEQR